VKNVSKGDRVIPHASLGQTHPRHVDAFIEDPKTDAYASWILAHFRFPAILQSKFAKIMKDKKLFCSYKTAPVDGLHIYRRYRVTGASRFGDVWLATSFDREVGYDLRVSVDDCIDWSDKP
jgi:hypothetical protein